MTHKNRKKSRIFMFHVVDTEGKFATGVVDTGGAP